MNYANNYIESYKQTIEKIRKIAKKEKKAIRLLADISLRSSSAQQELPQEQHKGQEK